MSWFALGWLACVAAPQPQPAPQVAPQRLQTSQVAPYVDPRLSRYTFVETVTAGADPNQPLPLIVAVHGLGDRPESFTRLLGRLPFAARVVAPLAPTPYGRGGTWFATSARASVSSGKTGPIAAEMRQAAADFVPWLTALTESRPTVGKPIVTGFSQGGMMAFTLAVYHGEAIEKAVPVSGWLPIEMVPDSTDAVVAPILAVHGTADDVLPFKATQDAVMRLKERGKPAKLQVFEGVGHSIPASVKTWWFDALAPALSD